MALYPCFVNSHRYAGPQSSLYLTVVKSNTPVARKVRLCSVHFDSMLNVAARWLRPVDDTVQGSLVCESCDGPSQNILFMTAYADNSEGDPYAADLCDRHAHEALAALGWPEWASRGA